MSKYNICRLGRECVHLTQEQWAETLDYSVGTIKDWEREVTPISNKVIQKIVDITGKPIFAYWYLYNQSVESSFNLLPEIEIVDLPRAVIMLYNRLHEIEKNDSLHELLKIAEDGKIDETELQKYNQIISELDELVKAIYTLKYSAM